MSQALSRAFHLLCFASFSSRYEEVTIIPILQRGKLRHKELKCLIQGRGWQIRNLIQRPREPSQTCRTPPAGELSRSLHASPVVPWVGFLSNFPLQAPLPSPLSHINHSPLCLFLF